MTDRSHLTAIARKAPSKPLRFLIEHDLIKGRVLDYGSGRGFDACAIRAEQWDPHFHPMRPHGRFDTIMCFYVLNVVEAHEQPSLLRDLRDLLCPGGVAYVAVRRDLKAEGKTSRGTYQRNVVLPLPTLHEGRDFALYVLRSA